MQVRYRILQDQREMKDLFSSGKQIINGGDNIEAIYRY